MRFTLDRLMEPLSPATRAAIALAFTMLLGVLDLATGHDVSFLIMYIAPISLAAWYAGPGIGMLTAVFSALFWFTDSTWGRSIRLRDVGDLVEKSLILVLLAALVRRIRLALDRAESLASTDPLTGLANRRTVFGAIRDECRALERHGEPITVVYLDLDNFKEVNDRHGHDEGDRLLVTMASILRAAVRPTDMVARVGGDEFVILLPRTPRPEADRVATRVREDLALAAAAHGWPVTFSAGAVTWEKCPGSVEEVMHRADAAMYEAKTGGKNRTVSRTAD